MKKNHIVTIKMRGILYDKGTHEDTVTVAVPTTSKEIEQYGKLYKTYQVPKYRCDGRVFPYSFGSQVKHIHGYTGIVQQWANGEIVDYNLNMLVKVAHDVCVTWNVMDLEDLQPSVIE
jgi:hypothetical protein